MNSRRYLIEDEIKREMATGLTMAELPTRAAQAIDIALTVEERRSEAERLARRNDAVRRAIARAGSVMAGILVGICIVLVVAL